MMTLEIFHSGGFEFEISLEEKPYLDMDSARMREASDSDRRSPESATALYCWLAWARAADNFDLTSGGASERGSKWKTVDDLPMTS